MQQTGRAALLGGLIGACSLYCTFFFFFLVLYECDEESGGESRGSEQLHDA